MTKQEKLHSILRDDLNKTYVSEDGEILKYLNPAYLSGDNEKYMQLYNKLAPLYDFGERWIGWLKYGNTVAKMRSEMM